MRGAERPTEHALPPSACRAADAAMADRGALDAMLADMAAEARELHVPRHVRRVAPPSALEFYREYVATNTPVVIVGAAAAWPAMQAGGPRRWTEAYLRERMAGRRVHVAASPTGYADAEVDGRFVLPEERLMDFGELSEALARAPEEAGEVLYAQYQNGSLEADFPPLLEDVSELAFAREAFGQPPDAVNFWMGPNEAVTSLHRDPYENLYTVVAGTKVFTLLPPTDQGRVPSAECPVYRYRRDGDEWLQEPEPDIPPVRWTPAAFDRALAADADARELSGEGSAGGGPLRVRLEEGETLYLPSGWYHSVAQRGDDLGRTVAVNYWYDQAFDARHAYFGLVRELSRCDGRR